MAKQKELESAPCPNSSCRRSSAPGFLSLLPRKREAVRQFTPSWFTVTMGTGSVAITVGLFPYQFTGQAEIGWAIWWLTLVFFLLFAALMLGRVIFYSHTMPKLFAHPNQSMFVGAIPMSVSTLINGVVIFWVPRFGAAAATVAHAMFWINLPLVLGCILLIPLSMFTMHRHGLHSMSAVWLIPVVPACVAANTAGVLAAKMSDPAHAVTIMYTGICLLGIGFLLSYQICTIYYSRLTFHSLPAKEIILSCFLPVGPMAMTAWAVLNLCNAAASQYAKYVSTWGDPTVNTEWLEHQVLPVITAAGGAAAMFLWGFATWWLLLAVCSMCATVRQGIPFNLGWWGSVFPLGVYTGATIHLGHVVHSNVFTIIGAVAVGMHVAVWLVVVSFTVRKAWTGQLFHAPCLAPPSAAAAAVAAAAGSSTAGSTDAAVKVEQQLAQDVSVRGGKTGPARSLEPSVRGGKQPSAGPMEAAAVAAVLAATGGGSLWVGTGMGGTESSGSAADIESGSGDDVPRVCC